MAVVQDQLIFELDGKAYCPVMVWDDEDDDEKPVVMVCGTILGRNDFAIDRAKAIQKLGYIGVAMDIYGEGFATGSFEEGGVHMNNLLKDREELRSRLDAGIQFIAGQPNVDSLKLAVMGYCFGGLCALDVARARDDVLACASFHGSLQPLPRTMSAPINAKVLILHGDRDPHVPPKDVDAIREELTQREADWQIHNYGFTYHSFAVPGANNLENGLKFNPIAQRRSWDSLSLFLKETF